MGKTAVLETSDEIVSFLDKLRILTIRVILSAEESEIAHRARLYRAILSNESVQNAANNYPYGLLKSEGLDNFLASVANSRMGHQLREDGQMLRLKLTRYRTGTIRYGQKHR